MRKDRKQPDSGRSPRSPATSDRRGQSRRPSDPRTAPAGPRIPRIVGPGQEHGVPYPGDIPNPLAGKYRGCF